MRTLEKHFGVFLLAAAGFIAVGISGCGRQAVKPETTPQAQPQAETKALSFGVAYFEYNQASIRSSARTVLKAGVDLLLANPDVKINIDGHCDERGTDEYNMNLGWKRAYAVRDYLKRLGIDESRLFPASYGRSRPAVVGNDESSWSKNRRVEISVRQ